MKTTKEFYSVRHKTHAASTERGKRAFKRGIEGGHSDTVTWHTYARVTCPSTPIDAIVPRDITVKFNLYYVLTHTQSCIRTAQGAIDGLIQNYLF